MAADSPEPPSGGRPGGGEPFWLPTAGRPIAARLHLPPDRRPRAAVVLCPPLGYEQTLAHRALRLLAADLAACGLAALRLDYDGTGESWGLSTDPDRLSTWHADVTAAVAYARGLGTGLMAAVGLRLGATLAAGVDGVDALVLWDPVLRGRDLARRLRAAAALGGSSPTSGAVAVDGTLVSVQMLADLGDLELRAPVVPTLALLRPAVAGAGSLGDADVRVAEAQPALLSGDSLSARVPAGSLQDIVGWLDARAPAPTTGPVPPVGPREATVDGVRETFVEIDGMAAVRVEPAGAGAGLAAPTVLPLPVNVDPRGGGGRAWVEWSRELARAGLTSLRADLSGIGDSPARPGAPEQRPYGPHALADVRALVAAADAGHGVALVGLCSGARNAIDAAVGLPVTDLLLVNPVLSVPRGVLEQLSPDELQPADVDAPSLPRRIRHQVAGRLPGPVWWAVHRSGLLGVRTAALLGAVSAGAQVLVVYSAGDYVLLQPAQNAHWALADLRATGRFTIREVVADHALLDPQGRRDVLAELTAHLLDRYAADAVEAARAPR